MRRHTYTCIFQTYKFPLKAVKNTFRFYSYIPRSILTRFLKKLSPFFVQNKELHSKYTYKIIFYYDVDAPQETMLFEIIGTVHQQTTHQLPKTIFFFNRPTLLPAL